MSSKLLRYYNNFLSSTSTFQQGRGVKIDDIYIYHVHTLSLLSACLQNKHRRGRLHFKERGDDVDMNTSDTAECSSREYIYQVISTTNIFIYYYINKDKDTTHICIICRYTEDLHVPRVKLRIQHEESFDCTCSKNHAYKGVRSLRISQAMPIHLYKSTCVQHHVRISQILMH
jgi:hypothetical protein